MFAKTRNTKQKRDIIAFFENNSHQHFSGGEIEKNLCDISRATIYRTLKELENENVITKSENKYCFSQCCEHSHLHLKCETCGEISHFSDNELDETLQKLNIDAKKTTFRGICKRCAK